MSEEQRITIWEAKNNLTFDEPLAPNDKKMVDLSPARGNFTLKRLYSEVNVEDGELNSPPKKKYLLFTGHRGCGKSTELLRVAKYLHDRKRYFVIQLDCVKKLDTNNLKYSDVILALTSQLLSSLEANITVDNAYLDNIENWFKTRVISHEKLKHIESEIVAGAKAQLGLPYLTQLFAGLTNKLKIGATYREDVREVINNNATELADSFNQLIRAAEAQIQKKDLGKRILFTIDGTDRLEREDAYHFFIEDVNQLTLIDSLFIYCAPIHLLNGNNTLRTSFSGIVRLPMLKIRDCDNNKIRSNYHIVRNMVYHRVPAYWFDSEDTVNYLIEYSGGHPRELLRLINTAINYRDEKLIDKLAAERAVQELANDYRRSIKRSHYERLVEIDENPEFPDDFTDDITTQMLFDLVLLEYNDFFWKSHPVITTLAGYQKALSSYKENMQ